jgi:hypothetical protein
MGGLGVVPTPRRTTEIASGQAGARRSQTDQEKGKGVEQASDRSMATTARTFFVIGEAEGMNCW